MLLRSFTKHNLHHITKGNTKLVSAFNATNIKQFSHSVLTKQQEITSEETTKKSPVKKVVDSKVPLLKILQKELHDEIKTRDFLTTPPSIVADQGFEVLKSEMKQVVVTLKKDLAEESVYVFVDVDEYVNNYEAENLSYEESEMNEEYQGESTLSTMEFVIVKKQDNSAMSFTVLINEAGLYGIDKISYFNDFSLLYSNEANDALNKNLAYGVNFKQLDSSVQEHMINYLVSRGLDEDLLTLIDEVASKEEQKRYEEWLANAAKFLS